MTRDELLALSNLYGALSACFQYPRLKLVEALLSGRLVKVMRACIDAIAGLPSEASRGASMVERYVESARARRLREVVEELSTEYTRLFINSYPAVPCPPYESFYVDGGLLAQGSTLRVLRAYVEAGLRVKARFKDLPDHIALELEFMSILYRAEAQEEGSVSELRRSFLRDHLLRWAPRFCDDVLSHARVPLYRGLAYTLKGLMSMEASRLVEGRE